MTACEDELLALKPGNVHIYANGHRMTVEDFRQGAGAAAPFIAERSLPVGARIKSAVQASLATTGQNVNLGIVLLCAPLAHAASLQKPPESLRQSLRTTLASLSNEDAVLTFEAIALANPGGLGKRENDDVRGLPSIGLLRAMQLAADFDRIARAYVTDFEDIFDFGLPRYQEAEGKLNGRHVAISALFLAFLAAFPDSHIHRKFGPETAKAVQAESREIQPAFWAATPAERMQLLASFDASLKQRGFNPGTSADLTVATLFATALLRMQSPLG